MSVFRDVMNHQEEPEDSHLPPPVSYKALRPNFRKSRLLSSLIMVLLLGSAITYYSWPNFPKEDGSLTKWPAEWKETKGMKGSSTSQIAELFPKGKVGSAKMLVSLIIGEATLPASKVHVWPMGADKVVVCEASPTGARAPSILYCEKWVLGKEPRINKNVDLKETYRSQLYGAMEIALSQPGERVVVTSMEDG